VSSDPALVARRYFDAISRRDLDAAEAAWLPGGIDHLIPVGELEVPTAWRPYFERLFAAFPDFTYEVLDTLSDGARAVVKWRASGHFTGAPFEGIRATGVQAEITGLDLVDVDGDRVARIESYWDDASITRQLGLLPARGSRQERLLVSLFNLRSRLRLRRRANQELHG
jgi:predicted ester cyclase